MPGSAPDNRKNGGKGPDVADARSDTPETDRGSPQDAPEAAGRNRPSGLRPAAPPASAIRGASGRDLTAPLAAGAAAGAVAGIVNSGAGAVQGILAGLAAGFATGLLLRAIAMRSSRQRPEAMPTGHEPAGSADRGETWTGAAMQQATVDLVRRMPVPAVLVSEGRDVLAVSRGAEDLLRRVAEGRPLPDSIRHPELLAAVQQSVEDGVEREVTIRESVPQDRHLQALVAPLGQPARAGSPDRQDGSGREPDGLRGALILLRDLTPQIQADRMRGDLVANVSHELRTPLASLAGFLETLRGPAANDAAAQERFLRIMEEQTARMTRLVDSLLSLSNIEMDEHRPPTGRVELNATVRRVIDALKIVAERLDSRIVAMHELEPAEIVGDEDQIARVARNLIENAIKYGKSGTAIEVRVFAPGGSGPGVGEVAVSVTDCGEGIPEEHLPRLTERFYRVDIARARNVGANVAASSGGNAAGAAGHTPDSGGAGLGLAIVKHILARHGGRLEITSEIGVGSRFTAVFPPAPAAASLPPGETEPGQPA